MHTHARAKCVCINVFFQVIIQFPLLPPAPLFFCTKKIHFPEVIINISKQKKKWQIQILESRSANNVMWTLFCNYFLWLVHFRAFWQHQFKVNSKKKKIGRKKNAKLHLLYESVCTRLCMCVCKQFVCLWCVHFFVLFSMFLFCFCLSRNIWWILLVSNVALSVYFPSFCSPYKM